FKVHFVGHSRDSNFYILANPVCHVNKKFCFFIFVCRLFWRLDYYTTIQKTAQVFLKLKDY
ncbi:hypothetical protein, partial [Paenisporosarcina sp. NPDC076898]|uniref:hypothetical protein n=1 Tax=unclassified Paenisporosarcina TaxID=2642018 RepID=UPI003D07199E